MATATAGVPPNGTMNGNGNGSKAVLDWLKFSLTVAVAAGGIMLYVLQANASAQARLTALESRYEAMSDRLTALDQRTSSDLRDIRDVLRSVDAKLDRYIERQTPLPR